MSLFLHISHIVLTSSPHEPQQKRREIYILGFFAMLKKEWLKHRYNGRIDYGR